MLVTRKGIEKILEPITRKHGNIWIVKFDGKLTTARICKRYGEKVAIIDHNIWYM